MAKKLFTTFRAAVDSFPLGEQNVGLLKPGRYNGYTEIITRGALDISIKHSGSIRKTNKTNTYEPEFGAILFGTGIIIHDEDDVELTVVSNSGNSNARVDYVIAENTYQEIQGGSPVIYSIIQGPSNGTEPVLSNPAKQILVGKIIITGNGYLFTNLTYSPIKTPLPGDLTYNQLTTIINQSIPDASYTKKGIVEKATQTEVNTGTDEDRFVTPKGLHNKKATNISEGVVRFSTDEELYTGTDDNLAATSKQIRGRGKTIELSSNYILQEADYGKVFISSGISPIIVTVPPGLTGNQHFGFIYGTSTIKLVGGTGVTLKAAPGKLLEIKDANTPMLLESDLVGDTYFVMGNLKNI